MPHNNKKVFCCVYFNLMFHFIIALSLFSCKADQKKEDQKEDQNNIQTSLPAISSGCYQLIIKQDTAFMKLNIEGNKASGFLRYKPAEKDKNEGTFEGIMIKDTLNVWYKFSSEGLVTVRQVRMKAVKDGFAEGYGDVDQKLDTAYYKYPYTLNYEENNIFRKINCP